MESSKTVYKWRMPCYSCIAQYLSFHFGVTPLPSPPAIVHSCMFGCGPMAPGPPWLGALQGPLGPEAAGPTSVAPDRCPAAPAAPPHKMASVTQQPRLLPKRRAAPAPGRGRSQETGDCHGFNRGTGEESG